MSKHTPGPWRFGDMGKHAQHIDGGAGDREWFSFAKVYVRVDGEDSATGEANARLIAAAPELLEAAQELRRCQRDYLADPAGERSNDKGRLVGIAAEKLDAVITKATEADA